MRHRRLIVLTFALSAVLVSLVGVGPVLGARLEVPSWGQRDPRWSSLHLGTSSATMYWSGCAVTSCAVVGRYFGSTKDPGQLCLALDANGGFDSSGNLSWAKVPSAEGGTIALVGVFSTDLGRINGELDAGNPVIAEVSFSGNTHFVVLTGHDGGTYYINDPRYGDSSTINERYGNPATAIHCVVIFHGRHAFSSCLSLNGDVSESPAAAHAGDTISTTFTVKNSGDKTGTWAPLVLTLRDPFGKNCDEVAASALSLSPGESRSFTVQWKPDWTGKWTAWVAGSQGGVWLKAAGNDMLTIAVTPSDPPTPPLFSRVQGSDRYQTAIALSKAGFPSGAPAVILVTGDNYPDTLCAAPLAKAYHGPILLSPSAGLTASIKEELARLNPSQVFIVGLGPAIRAEVRQTLPAAGLSLVTGHDRYETAVLVAELMKAKLGTIKKVVVAPGDSFPDGLAVAALAASQGWPILLTPQGGTLPPVTANELVSLGSDSGLVVGTYAHVDLANVAREVGPDRYATCALIAQYAQEHGASFAHTALATGEDFPDALVAGAYLAIDDGILLLTRGESVPSGISALLSANVDRVQNLDFIALPGLAAQVGG